MRGCILPLPTLLKDKAALKAVAIVGIAPRVSTNLVAPSINDVNKVIPVFIVSESITVYQNSCALFVSF